MTEFPSWQSGVKEQKAHPDVQKSLCEAIAKAEEVKAFGVVSLVWHEGGFYLAMGAADEHQEPVYQLGKVVFTLLNTSLAAVANEATEADMRDAAERDAYREALAVIARDIADDGSVTQQQVDAAYALARECAGVGK